MTTEQRAYLAGLIDGEGCLRLQKHKKKNRRGERVVATPAPHIEITNTDARMIGWLHQNIGGAVYYRPSPRAQWSGYYKWRLNGVDRVRRLLEEVFPFLIVKRQHAKVLLEFASTPNDRAARTSCIARLTALNKKGPLAPPTENA